MPQALKAFFDRARVERLADELVAAWPPFPRDRFVGEATRGLDRLELLDRGRHIAAAMAGALPPAYPEALAVLLRSLGPPLPTEGNGMEAFHHHPHAVFVEMRGLDHPEESLAAMREITRRASCEFAIRPFLLRHPDRTLATLREWTRDPDPHVRRLVSEGTRPRLPWAPRLPAFQEDPAPVLALLEELKDDPSGYVRRSVANNLNDISKDNPDAARATCARWLEDATPERRRLVEHALRSLVRAGDAGAVRQLGGGGRLEARATISPRRARIGGSVRFAVTVRNPGRRAATAVLSLRIHFVKARGGTSPRSFKLPTTVLAPGATATLAKTVSLRQQTTRTHYPGRHAVDLVVNGEVLPAGGFWLDPPRDRGPKNRVIPEIADADGTRVPGWRR